MHEITVCFGAVGKVPVEREKLMMQERGESCGVLSFSRWRKIWPSAPVGRPASDRSVRGKLKNMDLGASGWWKHVQRHFISLTSFPVTLDEWEWGEVGEEGLEFEKKREKMWNRVGERTERGNRGWWPGSIRAHLKSVVLLLKWNQ